jgi:hypothetical protein
MDVDTCLVKIFMQLTLDAIDTSTPTLMDVFLIEVFFTDPCSRFTFFVDRAKSSNVCQLLNQKT